MKIRIKGNTVRYRLTKSEVEIFSKKGYLEESTCFPSGAFTYAMEAKSGIDNLTADFFENKLTIYFPESEKENWYSSNRIGFEHQFPISKNQQLHLLIEKDFVCIDRPDEDQSDNYPNPSLSC